MTRAKISSQQKRETRITGHTLSHKVVSVANVLSKKKLGLSVFTMTSRKERKRERERAKEKESEEKGM